MLYIIVKDRNNNDLWKATVKEEKAGIPRVGQKIELTNTQRQRIYYGFVKDVELLPWPDEGNAKVTVEMTKTESIIYKVTII